jgi:SAM-dependent methyltransferase
MTRVRDLFDAWARAGRAEGMERGHTPAARQAFDRLGLRDDGRYLDIGCGNGYTVRWAARAAPRGVAVGIDASGEMIRRAQEMSEGLPNAVFVQGDFPGTEIPGAPFDAIFSMEVFYYLPDLHAALAEVRALLRPRGLFACVVDHYAENAASHGWSADLGVPMTLLDAAGWAEAFRHAGLEVVEQGRLRVEPSPGVEPWKASEGSLFTLGRR